MESNATQREVVRKSDGQVFPVTGTAFDTTDPANPVVVFTTDSGEIVFKNPGLSGNLINDEYDVREVTQ